MAMGDDQFDIPPKLASAMRALRADIAIPDELDDAILAEARTAIARRRWHRGLLRWAGVGAAAAVMVLTLRVPVVDRHPAPRVVRHVALREDLDGNGHVDILDAFYLARQLGSPTKPAWDINADGRIDQKDVDAIAQSAVRVGETL